MSRIVFLVFIFHLNINVIRPDSFQTKVSSEFLDSRETYDFVELLPEEVDKFFYSLTDSENLIWQTIYLQQLATYSNDPENTTFEVLDQAARSINADIARRMLEPRRAIMDAIARLGNDSAEYVLEAYTAFRWMRMDMGNRVKVLRTILNVCKTGKALPKEQMDDIATEFPVIPRYIQNENVLILMAKSKTMKISELYDEMVLEAKRLI